MNITASEEAKAPGSNRAGCTVYTDDEDNQGSSRVWGKVDNCEPGTRIFSQVEMGVGGAMAVIRRDRMTRAYGRATDECPERDNGMRREWEVPLGPLGCERSSSILLRGVPRVNQVLGRRQTGSHY